MNTRNNLLQKKCYELVLSADCTQWDEECVAVSNLVHVFAQREARWDKNRGGLSKRPGIQNCQTLIVGARLQETWTHQRRCYIGDTKSAQIWTYLTNLTFYYSLFSMIPQPVTLDLFYMALEDDQFFIQDRSRLWL